MSDPTTANMQLAQPTRGSDTGTWDVPVNGNMTILDGAGGGITTIGLNNTTVTLSSAQFINKQIVFNSTLTANVAIVFPSTFIKSYEIFNQCTGSSANTITLYVGSTSAGGQVIACPPQEIFDCVNDGTNFRFKNLGHIGKYWDYGGSSVPNWVSGCTVPPYLACTGGTFSAATFPALAIILGSTTLPDSRGRTRYSLDAGASRVLGIVSSANANTIGFGAGDQNYQQHAHNYTEPNGGTGHSHTTTQGILGANTSLPSETGGANPFGSVTSSINNSVTGITISNAGTGGSGNLPPLYFGGITMIRAG